MPRRIHRYDRQAYQMVLPKGNIRYRKAFFFVERLSEIDSVFRSRINEIRAQLNFNQISAVEADKLVSKAVMEAIEREKQK